jgi:hypothetical protein
MTSCVVYSSPTWSTTYISTTWSIYI